MSAVKGFITVLAMGIVFVLASGAGSSVLNATPVRSLDRARVAAGQELAQRGDWQERAQARFDSMCVYLGLDDKQSKQVKDLNKEMQDKMSGLRDQMQSGSMDREAMRGEVQKITEEFQTKLKAVLTKDQQAKLEKWNADHPRRMGRRQG